MREKYESLSLAVLKDLAKARGIKGLTGLKKEQVIELMLAEDEKDKAKPAPSPVPVAAQPEKKNVTYTVNNNKEGQAEAVLKVQSATAEGLRMIKEAGADQAVLTLKSLEAFVKAADGQATKIIIPSEIQGIAGLASSLKGIIDDKKES